MTTTTTPATQASPETKRTHRGSCHCGDVRFEVVLDVATATRCNCTICTKTAATGGMVKPDAFTLLTDIGLTNTYAWGSKSAERHFCKRCGVHVFGRGHLAMLGGDFVSINVNCLDDIDHAALPSAHWDGRHNNWQAGTRDRPWSTL